ncbi:MAG: DUF362 domain-containing protein [Candidatus Bathyarchaeota archaeon]
MSRVAIVKGSDPIEMTIRSLEMIQVSDFLSAGKPFLIKPNYINSQHPSTGITTDARVVEGIVKFLKERKVEDITIGEGSGWGDTFQAFKVAGIDSVAERWGVKLIDLNKDEFVEVTTPNPLSLKRISVAKTALERIIISVPKLKVHGNATVTLSLKNMMGALAFKGTMHDGQLSKNIADLASILKPSIAVIDGIIAAEGHETRGRSVSMNVVITGTDPVAVDAVGSAVMGISPESVKHIRFAEEKKLGTCNIKEITVLGETVENVKRKFHR